MTHFLKTLLLVNSALAVTFGIFGELCHLCVQSNITPWLAIPATMAFCGFIFIKTVGVISRRFG